MSVFVRTQEDEDFQDEVKELIERGREQGFLTYEEINETLPEGAAEGDKFEEIVALLAEMGIDVVEAPPEEGDVVSGEDEEELANNVLLSDNEIGRTTDPVRMYMREMGAVDLLTREGEIAIAKRIESGLSAVQQTLADFPPAIAALIEEFQKTESGEARLGDLVNGYGDPYAENNSDELAAEEGDADFDEDDESISRMDGDEEDEDGEGAAPAVNNGNNLEETREKLLELAEVFKKFQAALKKGQGLSAKKTQKMHEEIKLYMCAFSFPIRTNDVSEERQHEPGTGFGESERR